MLKAVGAGTADALTAMNIRTLLAISELNPDTIRNDKTLTSGIRSNILTGIDQAIRVLAKAPGSTVSATLGSRNLGSLAALSRDALLAEALRLNPATPTAEVDELYTLLRTLVDNMDAAWMSASTSKLSLLAWS